MKKILALVLVAVLILTCAVIPASANESDNSLIQPHYEVVCPGGAQHIMVAKGIAQVYTGTLYNPGTLIFSGCSAPRAVLSVVALLGAMQSIIAPILTLWRCFMAVSPALFMGISKQTPSGSILLSRYKNL